MNKRSAVLIAGGLVAALLAGVVAFNLTLGSTSKAAVTKQKPIVRTITHTKTIHKKAKNRGSGGGVVTVVRPAPSSGGSNISSSGFSGDDGFESEGPDHEDGGGGGEGGDD